MSDRTKTFDTREFESAHFRKPKGRGSWGFENLDTGAQHWPVDEFGNGTLTFTEARKATPAGRWKVLP